MCYVYTVITEEITTTKLPELDCDVGPPTSRVNCGFVNMKPEDCYERGCCWDSSVRGVPWCFYGKYKINTVDILTLMIVHH